MIYSFHDCIVSIEISFGCYFTLKLNFIVIVMVIAVAVAIVTVL